MYAALGVPRDNATLLADTLVQADLWGHPSHGVMRLPWYARRLQSGVMRAVTQAETIVDAGAVAVRHSNHFGAAMYYSRMGAAENCVVMVTTNASPAMAPWGGREKRVGTNPWSLAAPAGRYAPMVLDIANTAAAAGI